MKSTIRLFPSAVKEATVYGMQPSANAIIGIEERMRKKESN